MREAREVFVSVIDGQDCCADPLRVRDPFEQLFRCGTRRDDEQRLATRHCLQPVEPHGEMRWRVRRWRVAHECRRQLEDSGEAGLVVEVCGEVPRLLLRSADEQQATGSRGRTA